ncbi:MAG: hypothetical protein ACRC5T_10835, partial [Cetobacterium sp.]
ISIEYTDGSKGVVKCTVSDEKNTVYSNDTVLDKNIMNYNILKQDLIDNNLPIKGFKTITYNREKYEVRDIAESSTFGNTIKVSCVKIGV